MKHLTPSEHFSDLYYHRVTSPVYRTYLEGCGVTTFSTHQSPYYAWTKSPLGINIAKYERMDTEPDLDQLRAMGIRHGIVAWIPESRTDIPTGWRRLYLSSHFQETGFSLVREDYPRYWSERARRARKKFIASGAEVRLVDPETFVAAFRATRIRQWLLKSDYITFYKKMVAIDPSSVRAWLCYRDGLPVAGLAVHDYGEMSVHLVAFTGRDAYPIQ